LRPLTEALIKVTTKANRHSSTGWEPFVGFVVRDFRSLVLIIRHDRISPGKWLWAYVRPEWELSSCISQRMPSAYCNPSELPRNRSGRSSLMEIAARSGAMAEMAAEARARTHHGGPA